VPRTRVVIQSRLDSSRLPGKALLTVAGMPLIELVARRAARSGHEVVVATSEERYDERIAAHLSGVGIAVLRGSLDDVLGRFAAATADLHDSDRVVRLTGDNPLADADLVDELIAALDASPHTYGRVDIERVPEGLGAEVFTAGALRQAAASATAAYDREHVTPWLRRELGELLFVPTATPADPHRYRCTVDVLADYDRVWRVFAAEDDPVGVPWPRLLDALGSALGADVATVPVRDRSELGQSALILGATQLGFDYGICNTSGRPSMSAVRAMLRAAVERGITHADTARGDGDSEATLRAGTEPALARRLQTITKVGPLGLVDPGGHGASIMLAVEASVERSFAELGRRHVDAVVLQHCADAVAVDGAAWQRLLEYHWSGEVGRIGICLRSPDELPTALGLDGIGYLTLPFNVLDRRWFTGEGGAIVGSQDDVVVTAHSIYLQGLLPASVAPRRPVPVDVAGLRSRLARLAVELGRESVADLCMAYVLGHPWVTSVAVGAENERQVQENARLATLEPLSSEQCEAVRSAIPAGGPELVDTERWPTA
jgi:spore coat polysaccharide biosynthesis protein SpsF (cytidylyltransferase family)/aryl-alcohol dehydrogenase-like predicted oxidoreductase